MKRTALLCALLVSCSDDIVGTVTHRHYLPATYIYTSYFPVCVPPLWYVSMGNGVYHPVTHAVYMQAHVGARMTIARPTPPARSASGRVVAPGSKIVGRGTPTPRAPIAVHPSIARGR